MRPRYVLVDADDTVVSTEPLLPPNPGEDKPDRYSSITNGLPKFALIIVLANSGKLPPLGFCTGREASFILGLCRWLRVRPNFWSIVESGLILYNPYTEEREYHPLLTKEVRRVFEEINLIRIPRLVEKHPFLRQYKGKEVNAAIELRDGTATLADCERIIRESFRDIIDFLEINRSSIAIDISPRGIDKGAGVTRLAEVTGIPPSEMLLIDDSLGGKPAADKVGSLASPRNASLAFQELVLARGDKGYVSEFEFVEGVVDSILNSTGG